MINKSRAAEGFFPRRFSYFFGHAVTVALFLVVAWAYIAVPELIAQSAPFRYEKATLYFEKAPRNGQLIIPNSLADNVISVECDRVDEPVGSQIAVTCFAVMRRDFQPGLIGIFLEAPGWSFPTTVTDIKAGTSLWPSVMPVPVLQISLQLCLALALGWQSLKGESKRLNAAMGTSGIGFTLLPGLTVLAHWVLLAVFYDLPATFGGCANTSSATYAITMLLFVAPVGEELIYRGWGFRFLQSRISPAATILLTSVAFAAMHSNISGSPGFQFLSFPAAVTFVAGLTLGWLRHKTGSVSLCVLAHIFANAVAIVVYGCR